MFGILCTGLWSIWWSGLGITIISCNCICISYSLEFNFRWVQISLHIKSQVSVLCLVLLLIRLRNVILDCCIDFLVLFYTELIEMKANGIFDLLDEESKLPTPKPEHFTMEVHNRNKSHFRLSVCILIFFMFWSLLCLLSPKFKKNHLDNTFTKINGKQSRMLHIVFIEVVFIYYNSLIYSTTMFFLYVNYFDGYILVWIFCSCPENRS